MAGVQTIGISRVRSTRNSVGLKDSVFVPLILQVFNVVVIQVSREGDFTTLADGIFGSGDVYHRSFNHNNLERIAEAGATISIHNFYNKVVSKAS